MEGALAELEDAAQVDVDETDLALLVDHRPHRRGARPVVVLAVLHALQERAILLKFLELCSAGKIIIIIVKTFLF